MKKRARKHKAHQAPACIHIHIPKFEKRLPINIPLTTIKLKLQLKD